MHGACRSRPPTLLVAAAGDYVIHVALRHDVPKVLEGLRQLALAVERKVDPAINVPCHSSLQKALTGGKAMPNTTLRIGERCACLPASCLLHPWIQEPTSVSVLLQPGQSWHTAGTQPCPTGR